MASQTLPLILHEDAFYAYFKPYRHPESQHSIWGGHGLENFGKDFELVRRLNPHCVWTVVDGEHGEQWITPGIHYVNRICYLVTEVPHAGLGVEFRCPRRMSTLTPLGLKRQVNKLQRLQGIESQQGTPHCVALAMLEA
jgi:hypothetical protein